MRRKLERVRTGGEALFDISWPHSQAQLTTRRKNVDVQIFIGLVRKKKFLKLLRFIHVIFDCLFFAKNKNDKETNFWIFLTTSNWDCLSTNPAAIRLLEANPDKINWGHIARNPFFVGV